MEDKLIISGPLVERLRYDLPDLPPRTHLLWTDEQKAARREERRKFNLGLEVPDAERTAPSIFRTRTSIRRLIYANAWQYKDKNGTVIPPKFLTLTFHENIQDLKTANRVLTLFIQRFNRRFAKQMVESLKYLSVCEPQKRGAIHYHLVLFNFPFMHKVHSKIRGVYGDDRFQLKTISKNADADYVIGYISKYITKQANDGRFWGQKRYSTSKDLKRPTVYLNDFYADIVVEEISAKLTKSHSYSARFGTIEYQAYYLGDGKTLDSTLLALLEPAAIELPEDDAWEKERLIQPKPPIEEEKYAEPTHLF